MKWVPLTKIFVTAALSLAAVVLQTTGALAVLVAAELIPIPFSAQRRIQLKAVGMLFLFAILLGVVQYLGGGTLESAYVTGLRMLVMTIAFVLLLTTTGLQDLTASLVTQLHLPQEYAFMFTAALRFVPDFLAENKAVLEAQACRGVSLEGNALRRLRMYMAVVQPMVLKSLARSETMALSLELRGFGGGNRRYTAAVAPHAADYAAMALAGVLIAAVIYLRLQYGY